MLNFVSPEGYDLFQMVLHKAMIVVGGLGSIAGPSSAPAPSSACWRRCAR